MNHTARRALEAAAAEEERNATHALQTASRILVELTRYARMAGDSSARARELRQELASDGVDITEAYCCTAGQDGEAKRAEF